MTCTCPTPSAPLGGVCPRCLGDVLAVTTPIAPPAPPRTPTDTERLDWLEGRIRRDSGVRTPNAVRDAIDAAIAMDVSRIVATARQNKSKKGGKPR